MSKRVTRRATVGGRLIFAATFLLIAWRASAPAWGQSDPPGMENERPA